MKALEPKSQTMTETTKQPEVVPSDFPAVSGKVLIAESDPLFGRILKTKLEKWGYQVVLEATGNGAMEFYRMDNYRVVITSADLPGFNGVELCRAIRALRRPQYTYLLFTATGGDKDALVAGLAAGADEFMAKPLNALELGLRMKNAERLLALEDKVNLGGGVDLATGILTRYAFVQFFITVLAKSRRAKGIGALLFVTINNDMDIFHRFGFEAQFLVHKAVVDAVQPALRQSDLFARVDENEFCLLLHDIPMENVSLVSDRVHDLLKGLKVEFSETWITPTISLSVTSFPQDAMGAEEIIYEAPRQDCPVAK